MNKEEYYKAIKECLENNPGFVSYNKMYVEEINDNYSKMSINVDENTLNTCGIVHGGLIFGLADAAMSLAAKTNGREAITITSEINYIKACQGKKITAIANPVKVNSTTAAYKCEIYNDEDVLCATATGTYYFLDRDIK